MTDEERREIDGVVDTAIDRAVHSMMRVDPPLSTRARVLARLELPAHPFFTLPRLAATAAMAALIVLAIVLTREPVRQAPATTVAGRAVDPQARQPPAGRPSGPAVGLVEEKPTVRRAPPGPVSPQDDPPVTASLTGAIAIAPLRRLDPIVVRPLEPAPVAPEEIVIEPLAPIAELEIAPLFPSEGRD